MGKVRHALGASFAALFVASANASSPVPGESTVDQALATDVIRYILTVDSTTAKQCDQRRIVNTKILELWPDGHPRLERWTLDRCGVAVNYLVIFVPKPQGGTDFAVHLE